MMNEPSFPTVRPLPHLGLPLGAALLAVVLAACSSAPVGPNYRVPPEAVINRPAAGAPFVGAPASAANSSGGAPFVDAPLPAYWWRLYRDPLLDRLVEEALLHNTDLRQAVANLERERAIETEVSDAENPQLGLRAAPGYGHESGVQDLVPGYRPKNQGLYSMGASLSYQLDLFGRIRRSIEASQANGEAAQAALDLVRINVAAGTARAYADICSTGLRLESGQRSVQLQQEALDVSERLQSAGRAGTIDIARARSQLQLLDAALPPLRARRQASLYRLATLTGALPQDFPRDVAGCIAPPRVTDTVPVGDGAALLRRRPDIRVLIHPPPADLLPYAWGSSAPHMRNAL